MPSIAHMYVSPPLCSFLTSILGGASIAVAAEPENLPAVALLFGQLVKYGLFSYPKYIQRLISRGEEGLSFTEVWSSSIRIRFLWILM